MASVHRQANLNSVSWRVFWRQDGIQRSLSFMDRIHAERFAASIEHHGPAEALRLIEDEDDGRVVPTVSHWLCEHIDNLTGVTPGTVKRYRTYLEYDIAPVFGHLPITSVTDATIAKWVAGLQGSGKTIKNKHAFLSGAFNAAVKNGVILSNPCQGRRLPETPTDEMVCLTPAEFSLLHDCIPHQRWKNLATWLVTTGMRFSEATALTVADVNPSARTCYIGKAWKYGASNQRRIGPPKTRKSVRTISLSQAALDVIDLTAPDFLFTNGAGNPVLAQEFFKGGWKPGRDKAQTLGLSKRPRVHDLRHTCASWLIQAGVPLPVVQAQLGHQSITTTVNLYTHIDRRAADTAAAAIQHTLDGWTNTPMIERGEEYDAERSVPDVRDD